MRTVEEHYDMIEESREIVTESGLQQRLTPLQRTARRNAKRAASLLWSQELITETERQRINSSIDRLGVGERAS